MSYKRLCDRCEREIIDFTHHYIDVDKYKYDKEHIDFLLCQECFNLFTDLLAPYFPQIRSVS